MSFRILYSGRAVADMQEAYDWYEQQQEGLGNRFLDAIDETAKEIALFPFAYSSRHKNTREKLAAPFPYIVIYTVAYDAVLVQAVFAARKKPSGKYRIKGA